MSKDSIGDAFGPGATRAEAGAPEAAEVASSPSVSIPIAERRPSDLTPEMRQRIGQKLARDLVEAGGFRQGEEAAVAADIATAARHCGRYSDGYRLARALESVSGWDCDLQIAETLDGFSALASVEISDAEKAWAERNAITPPLPLGTRVKLRFGETGVITDIHEHSVAKYLVALDGDPRAAAPSYSRRVANFEDVAAQGIEAGTAEPALAGSVHESPVGAADAPEGPSLLAESPTPKGMRPE